VTRDSDDDYDDEVGSDNEDMNELGESEDEEDSDDDDIDGIVDEMWTNLSFLSQWRLRHKNRITVYSDQIVASPEPNPQPTKASYKPDNWVERNRIGLEKNEGTAAERVNSVAQLQSCINSVTRGTRFNLHLRHNRFGDQLMDNEEPILWHEQILNEYWNKLEAKIDNPNLDDAGYCRKN